MCKSLAEGGARCTGQLIKDLAVCRANGDTVGENKIIRELQCSPKAIKLARETEGDRVADALQEEQDARAAFCIANGGKTDADGYDFEGVDEYGHEAADYDEDGMLVDGDLDNLQNSLCEPDSAYLSSRGITDKEGWSSNGARSSEYVTYRDSNSDKLVEVRIREEEFTHRTKGKRSISIIEDYDMGHSAVDTEEEARGVISDNYGRILDSEEVEAAEDAAKYESDRDYAYDIEEMDLDSAKRARN